MAREQDWRRGRSVAEALIDWRRDPAGVGLMDGLGADVLDELPDEWKFWARPGQIAPLSDWAVWLIVAGRGFGKTRTGGDPLGDGPANRWDEVNGVEVALADPHDWLTSASVDAVLGGANLAMIGGELIAFRNADATGTGKFRLSGLLRGRFGTEFATALHGGGEVFALISPASLIQWSSAQASTGAAVLAKAVGSMEIAANVTAVGATLTGANLQPFAPVRVRVTREQDGTLQIARTRRSRIGFGCTDGSDAPLGEATERYIVTLTSSLGNAQSFAAGAETLAILPAQQAAVAGGLVTGGQISVAQVSAIVGPGPAAILVFQL